MSAPRVSHIHRVFKDNVFYREFPSLKALCEFMVENHFHHLKRPDSMKDYVSRYPKDGLGSYHGFTFEADPSWVGSKMTEAINDDTGDIIITKSVTMMGRKFYGTRYSGASSKISSFIKSGKKYKGYRFRDISTGYVSCPPNLNTTPVPIIGKHLRTGDVILCHSMTDAAKYIMNTQPVYNDTFVGTIMSRIKMSAENYMGKSNEMFGYSWSFPE